ncbi:MAG TPA: LysR family transcriptional regulator [Solirubrobacteraceae bacterium]|nr:LysR family transcriptional regulator [Solirubrobacteraceae bacterium]
MRVEPELRHLRAFVAVAEELHFTRAAQKLNLAQQALSSQIRALEAMLGVQLFSRSTRRVELTDAGRTLLAHAIPLLASASRAFDEVAETGQGNGGQVSVSYAPTARREILPRVLFELHRRYPRLEVHTCQAWWGPEGVIAGPADVAITRAPPPTDPRLRTATLYESVLGLVLGSTHPLAAGDHIDVARLGAETLEISARSFSPHFYDLIVGLLAARGFRGHVHEYENLGMNFLLDDQGACEHIAAGRAFGVGFEHQYPYLPPGLVWRAIEPPLLVPMNVCWLRGARRAVQNVVAVTLEVARHLERQPAIAA